MNPPLVNVSSILAGDHVYLGPADKCFFAGTYRCRGSAESLRSLVLGLKRSEPRAVMEAAKLISSIIPQFWKDTFTFVPVPPSSATRPSPLISVLKRAGVRDVRELIVQPEATPASHNGWRPPPSDRAGLYELLGTGLSAAPQTVVLFDDVLTTGSHFRAAKMTIRNRWNSVDIVGLFLARVCSRFDQCTEGHLAWNEMPRALGLRCHFFDSKAPSVPPPKSAVANH